MRKILALIMVIAMVASFAVVATAAEGTTVSPIAAYDFTGSKLSDNSARHLADIDIATEGKAANAAASDNGLVLTLGYFMLPENLFSDLEAADITGLTYSITYSKQGTDGNWWSERLASFAPERIDAEVDVAERPDESFFISHKGIIGTTKYPYVGDGDWFDGDWIYTKIPDNEVHNATITLDLASNVCTIYVDGEVLVNGENQAISNPDTTVAKLTAEGIKSFKANAVGIEVGGLWASGGTSMTIEDITIYSSALSAEQVATLNSEGWESLAGTPATQAPTTGAPETQAPETQAPETQAPAKTETPAETGKPTAPQTGFATVALAIAAIGSGAYVVSKKH